MNPVTHFKVLNDTNRANLDVLESSLKSNRALADYCLTLEDRIKKLEERVKKLEEVSDGRSL